MGLILEIKLSNNIENLIVTEQAKNFVEIEQTDGDGLQMFFDDTLKKHMNELTKNNIPYLVYLDDVKITFLLIDEKLDVKIQGELMYKNMVGIQKKLNTNPLNLLVSQLFVELDNYENKKSV